MSDKNTNISHKELLTFSNLTNLEWEFANLKVNNEEDEEFGATAVEYKKLNDLLAPENFVRIRKGENGEDIREQVYGEGEQGLFEMRQKAGIAMEYLEKLEAGNNEGAFLRDWEVIYGGDKYKILEEI